MTNKQPEDFQQRQQALDPSQSFAVRAPAGSGKTELLTQRVLTLLAQAQRPEEILCITFTKKAAAEMQQRVINALTLGLQPNPPEQAYQHTTWQLAQAALAQSQHHNWQLLDHPNRLSIKTIDGLSAQLTKQLPLLSQFGAQPRIITDPTPYYQQAIALLLEQLESDDAPTSATGTSTSATGTSIADEIETLLVHLDNDYGKVDSLLIQLLAKRDQWLHHLLHGQQLYDDPQAIEQPLDELWQESITVLSEHLFPHQSRIVELSQWAGRNLADSKQAEYQDLSSEALEDFHHANPLLACADLQTLPGTSQNQRQQWQGILQLLLKKDGDYRKALNKNQGFLSDGTKDGKALLKDQKAKFAELTAELKQSPEIADALNFVNTLPPAHIAPEQWQLLQSLTRILPILVAYLKIIFQQQGVADYVEISNSALQALGDEDEPTELALVLDHSINHILVDEFQDTAIAQIKLLQALTAGWQMDDGRTLFIVGDGMQSIYGFRNANVGLFLAVRQYGLNDLPVTPIDLSVNFRSEAGVIEWINDNFQHAFPLQDDLSRGAVQYSPSVAFNPTTESESVRLLGFQGDTAPEDEAQAIAKIVGNLIQQHPNDSTALLVRSRNHLIPILAALADAGLSWQAHELESLSADPVIADLMNLTKALVNFTDRTAWLGLLRGPYCGLELKDLLILADDPKQTLWRSLTNTTLIQQLSTKGQQRCQQLINVLAPALDNYLRKEMSLWLEGIWCALGGPLTLNSPRGQQNVNDFFQLVAAESDAGELFDLVHFEERLALLKASADQSIHEPSNGNSNHNPQAQLQVMTLHKSKGLEFDSVIIPALQKTTRSDDKAILLWQERLNHHGQERLFLTPRAATGTDEYPLYQWIRKEEKTKTQLENTRLLYVGATRAVKRLYLTACVVLDEKSGELKKPGDSSLLSSVWESFLEQAVITESFPQEDTQEDLFSAQPEPMPLRRIPLKWRAPDVPVMQALEAYRGKEHDFEASNRPEVNTHRTERVVGTVIHRVMNQLSTKPVDYWTDEEVLRCLPGWYGLLVQMGVGGEELESAKSQLKLAVERVLGDDMGRWIISSERLEAQSEWAVCHQSDGVLVRGVIDRTFVAEDGVRWIVDYKTAGGVDGDGEVLSGYRRQLEKYKLALGLFEEREVKVGLYFLDGVGWVEV